MALLADRVEAGRELAAHLDDFAGRGDVFVLGLARGGVPVAAEVARAIGEPLDVLVVRKVGVPGHEELEDGLSQPTSRRGRSRETGSSRLKRANPRTPRCGRPAIPSWRAAVCANLASRGAAS